MSARRDFLLPALLALAGLAISGFTILRGIEGFDEGLMLQAARRVGEGEVPYRDFLWVYGPAKPYLLAWIHDVVEPSLVPWRVLRTATDSAIAVVVFLLVRREAGIRWGLAAWLAAACAMAQPRTATPFPVPLLAGLLAILIVTVPGRRPGRRAALAGLLIGVAALWRLDFGIWGGVAALAAVAAGSGNDRLRQGVILTAAAAAAALLGYLPFALAAGPGDLLDSLIGLGARGRQELPFPLLYDGPLSLDSPRAFAEDAKDLLGYEVPALSVLALGLGGAAAVARARADRRVTPAWTGLLVLGAGCLAYLLSRADEFHTTPLVVVGCALLPLAGAWLTSGARGSGRGRIASAACAVVLGLLLAAGVANRASALLLPPTLERLDLEAADGVRVEPEEAHALEQIVAATQRRVPPGQPIYVATRRSDVIRVTNPLVYFLADRDNAYDKDFGPLTTAASQREIVAGLRTRARAVVRWTGAASVLREPNASGRSTGVRLVDRELAGRWRVALRTGNYELLVPRESR